MEEIHWLTYIMIILASYRFTHLIVFDKITEFIRKPFLKDKTYQDDDGHLKHKEIPTSKFGYLLNCYWCAGVWSAIFMALGYLYIPQIALPIIFIFSIAGAQAILETFVGVGVKLVDFLKSSSN
ncbi:DUF1360 domain-containing protein [Aquisalibacillus elongatus]|uniref:DUF1360 domain-containing protein n=1 Tax=Aquisalibacillus elongatus TaxID=485577 RepID=UPI001FEC7A11|nr:DUF1360 domain-containing protein [Aquisalibacillus elongatus]